MAYSISDLDSINAAIAGAAQSVHIGDRRVVFRSPDELLQLRRFIQQEINNAQGKTVRPGHSLADFSE